ncbi:hypothetical protein LCGC14_0386650 [marine sediment metagenome]|uniref:Uncharacterized protein n=1 Tax=marine sediment metagenome TaxID=412755 RepID=A0A0F9TIS0_9ZZZZ
MPATSKLKILLEAKNKASGPIRQVQGDLKGLDKAAGIATGGLGALGMVAGGATVLALSALSIKMVDTAVNIERLNVSFRGLARGMGQNADDMLAGMRKASHGMIADSELVLSANKAMLLGVAKNTDDLVKLMTIAGERGQAMGLSMSQAFNDIVTGLGRGSALILDNLGITVNLTEVNKEYAASLGKTAAALTEVERKQALVNAVLAQTGTGVEVIISPVEQLSASWMNFTGSIATFIAESTPLPALLTNVAEGLNAANDAMQARGDLGASYRIAAVEVERLTTLIEQYSKEMETATWWDRQNIKSKINQAQWALQLAQAIIEETSATVAQTAALQQAAQRLEQYSAGMQVSEQAAYDEAAAMDTLRAAVDKLNAARERMMSSIGATARGIAMGVSGAVGGEAAFAIYRDINTQLVDYRAQLYLIETDEDKINFLVEARGVELRNQYRTIYDTTTATRTYASAAGEVNTEFNKLKGTIESILSTSLNISADIGIDLDDMLPRQDAINEDARRLADVAVRGWDSPWAAYFQKEFPALWAEAFSGTMDGGDIKMQAASILRQFEQGLRPELLDKEAAKERVRTMLVGDANMAELAQEIATELADEMGNVPVSGVRSLVNRALGIVDLGDLKGKETGDIFGQGAVQGVGDAGTQMVATLNMQLKLESNVALIRTAGSTYGISWGSGFLETVSSNVPSALIALLVTLITPGVQANIAIEQTQTEAQ